MKFIYSCPFGFIHEAPCMHVRFCVNGLPERYHTDLYPPPLSVPIAAGTGQRGLIKDQRSILQREVPARDAR